MIKRDDVVALAELANDPTISSMRLMLVNPETVRQLARTWLAVDEAEVGEVVHLCTFDAGAECHVYRSERFPSELDGQRVKLVLVPEADSGGDRG